jgi:hypothetical protein
MVPAVPEVTEGRPAVNHVLAAGHMSAHDAAIAAWVTIVFVICCLAWGLLKLLRIVRN